MFKKQHGLVMNRENPGKTYFIENKIVSISSVSIVTRKKELRK